LVERFRAGEGQQGNCGREHDWAVVDVHNGTSPIPPTQRRAKRSHTADKRGFSGFSSFTPSQSERLPKNGEKIGWTQSG
jgi:hypothetical protein